MSDSALEAYTEAGETAESIGMDPLDPLRIKVVMNFALFHYEVLQNQQKGYYMAKQLFEDIVENMEMCTNQTFWEISGMLKDLRENLMLWSNELEEETQYES